MIREEVMKSRVLFLTIIVFLSSQICSGHPGNLKPDSRIDFLDYDVFADDWAKISDVNEHADIDWISIEDIYGYRDRIYKVEIDSNDYIYISASVNTSVSSSIYVLRKYSPDSNEPLWSLEGYYSNIAFDMNDYLYVAGSSIRKIDPNGSVIWSIDTNNLWRNIRVDSKGNIYAVSQNSSDDYTLTKFFPDNNDPDWSFVGPRYLIDLVVDDNDDIYLLDYDFSKSVLRKFVCDSNQPVWSCEYENIRMGRITKDPENKIIVTGWQGQRWFDPYTKVITVKHSPSSNIPLWTTEYYEPDTTCWPEAIVADSNGNIYICGCADYSGNRDFITIKYEPNGTESWVDRYDWAVYDNTKDIEVDSDGNIYVTGDTCCSEGLEDSFTTLKYNSEGDIVWKAQYYGPGSGRIVYEMESTAIDSKNNVYVGGSVGDDGGWIPDSQDYVLVKYKQIYELAEPVFLLEFLAQDIINLGLQQGIENSFLARLDTAIQLLEDNNENNDVAAINLLRAFINAVEAQRGKKISQADADTLIAAAQEIISLLSGE